METINKPFAPFGAIFHQLLSQNIRPKYAPFFFCGQYAYEEAKKIVEHGQFAFCLPIGQRFENFNWSIKGLRLVLYDTGGMSSLGVSKLAYSLLKNGAELIAIYSEQKRSTNVFTLKIKELQNGKAEK